MLDLNAQGVSSPCQLWLLAHQVRQQDYGDVMMANRAPSHGALSHRRGWQACHCHTEGEPFNAKERRRAQGWGCLQGFVIFGCVFSSIGTKPPKKEKPSINPPCTSFHRRTLCLEEEEHSSWVSGTLSSPVWLRRV